MGRPLLDNQQTLDDQPPVHEQVNSGPQPIPNAQARIDELAAARLAASDGYQIFLEQLPSRLIKPYQILIQSSDLLDIGPSSARSIPVRTNEDALVALVEVSASDLTKPSSHCTPSVAGCSFLPSMFWPRLYETCCYTYGDAHDVYVLARALEAIPAGMTALLTCCIHAA